MGPTGQPNMKHRGAPFRVFKIPGFQGSQHIPTYPNILHKGIQSGQTLTFSVAHVAHTSQQGMVDAQPRSMGTGRHREQVKNYVQVQLERFCN